MSVLIILALFGCVTNPNTNVSKIKIGKTEILNNQKQATTEQNISTEKNTKKRIGVLLPLTGQKSQIGKSILDSVKLAFYNRDNDDLTIFPRDTQGNPEGTKKAFQELLDLDIKVIIGPIFSENVIAISQVAKNNGVKLLTFSNDTRVTNEGVYTLGITIENQLKLLIDYSVNQNYKKFAVLVPNNYYGKEILRVTERYIYQLGGVITSTQLYQPFPDKMYEPVKKLANYEIRHRKLLDEINRLKQENTPQSIEKLEALENVDTLGEVPYEIVLIVAESKFLLQALVPILPYYDIDPKKVKFVGTTLWDDKNLSTEPALHGGWFPALETNNKTIKFNDEFKKNFKIAPTYISRLAYDSFALASVLLKHIESSSFDKSIKSENGFTGINGLFKFNNEGMASYSLAIKEIKEGGSQLIN